MNLRVKSFFIVKCSKLYWKATAILHELPLTWTYTYMWQATTSSPSTPILVFINSSAKAVSVCHSLPLQINFPNCFVMNLTQFAPFTFSLSLSTTFPRFCIHTHCSIPLACLSTSQRLGNHSKFLLLVLQRKYIFQPRRIQKVNL